MNVHGAHGYLLDAFLWDKTNTRDDAWGGTVAARTRFAVEVVREVKRLGRLHTAADAIAAFDIARDCYDRVSFDLIYARQDQSPEEQQTCQEQGL